MRSVAIEEDKSCVHRQHIVTLFNNKLSKPTIHNTCFTKKTWHQEIKDNVRSVVLPRIWPWTGTIDLPLNNAQRRRHNI